MFAFNAALEGLENRDLESPRWTVMIFECAEGSPPAGGLELVAPQPRLPDPGFLTILADGTVEFTELYSAKWEP